MTRSSLIPGFRFHPTDAELVMYYLKRKLLGRKISVDAVAEVNIYDFSPWDLPDKSLLKNGDLEWFFFCPKFKKYSSGARANRATETGFWKATGKDRTVKYKERNVATIKTLVFHLGHAGNGKRTDWVMHEYKMEDECLANDGIVQDTYVLCKVFEKSGAGPKNGAQYGAPFNEEEWDDDVTIVDPNRATNTLDHKLKGPATTTTTVPHSTCTLSLIGPGSSTVTCCPNTPNYNPNVPLTMNTIVSVTEPGSSTVPFSANDDMMLFKDIASILGVSDNDLNGNHENEAVQVDSTEKVNDMTSNQNDNFYNELVNLVNLDDLNETESENFKTDDYTYSINKILTSDDLDVELKEFYVD